MNKIYKVIWSKVRNCYVAVSEIAKRNGKSCTSVNCGAKVNRGHAGVALAIVLSLSMTGGGVAWAASEFITPISSETMTITTDSTKVEGNDNVYKLQRTGGTIDSAAGTGVTFTVEGNEGKVYVIKSYVSGNTIKIEEGGEVTTALRGGINNNSITVEGTAKNVAGGYIRQDTTYSGLGIMGNDVTNNTVTVKGNAVITGNELIGGNSYSGNVTSNSVEIIGGNVNVSKVYGGYSSSGNAGAAPVSNTKYGNTVNISGGTVNAEVYGGRVTSGTGKALYNEVIISGTGEVKSSVYGGDSNGGVAQGNSVEISGGKVTGAYSNVYGGQSWNSNSLDNSVKITGGTIVAEVRGGSIVNADGTAKDNNVSISGSATIGASGSTKRIVGGYAVNGAATGNTVNINLVTNNKGTPDDTTDDTGVIWGTVYGGYSESGNAGGVDIVNGNTVTKQGNIVTISGGTVSGNVYGGYVYEGTGSAINNAVDISGSATIGTSNSSSKIYGGYTGGTGNATGNTVNINLSSDGRKCRR